MNPFARRRGSDPERGTCATDGCGRRVRRGETYCASCDFERWKYMLPALGGELGGELTVDGVTGVRNIAHAAAERVLREVAKQMAAPMIPPEELDAHCFWCCYVLTEMCGWTMAPMEPPAVCAAHVKRRAAHDAMRQTIDDALRAGHTSAKLARDYRSGYLGSRLHDDDPM